MKSPSRGPINIWRKTQCEASHRSIPPSLGLRAPNIYQSRRRSCKSRGSSWCRREIVFSKPQFGEIRNARHPTAASHPAWVSAHHTYINLDVDRVKAGNLRGVVVRSCFRSPNSAKYAMRAIPPQHPTQLGSPRFEHISISTVIVSKQGIFEVSS